MMNITGFFGNLAQQYIAKYNERYDNLSASLTQLATPDATDKPLAPTVSEPIDSYQPSASGLESDNNQPLGDKTHLIPIDDSQVSDGNLTDNDGQPITDGQIVDKSEPATYSSQFSQLKYKLNMSFNLQALERTVYQLSSRQSGDQIEINEAFERLSSGSFGFSADLRLSGLSVTASGEVVESDRLESSSSKTPPQSLNGQGLKLGLRLSPSQSQSYELAVKRFTLRYQTDTNFSMEHFTRFQSQTVSMGDSNPEALGAYTDQAGQLATAAPNEVMEAFFNAVGQYLEGAEENLLAKATEYMEIAAAELGLSEEAIAIASAGLTGTIESFFDSASESVEALASRFSGPALLENEQTGIATPEIPDTPVSSEPAHNNVIVGLPEGMKLDPIVPLEAERDYLEALLQTMEVEDEESQPDNLRPEELLYAEHE